MDDVKTHEFLANLYSPTHHSSSSSESLLFKSKENTTVYAQSVSLPSIHEDHIQFALGTVLSESPTREEEQQENIRMLLQDGQVADLGIPMMNEDGVMNQGLLNQGVMANFGAMVMQSLMQGGANLPDLI